MYCQTLVLNHITESNLTFVCEDPPCFAMIHVLENTRTKCHLVTGILPEPYAKPDLCFHSILRLD